jgi:hypothetical protein
LLTIAHYTLTYIYQLLIIIFALLYNSSDCPFLPFSVAPV